LQRLRVLLFSVELITNVLDLLRPLLVGLLQSLLLFLRLLLFNPLLNLFVVGLVLLQKFNHLHVLALESQVEWGLPFHLRINLRPSLHQILNHPYISLLSSHMQHRITGRIFRVDVGTLLGQKLVNII
jgi:hypothetical protein